MTTISILKLSQTYTGADIDTVWHGQNMSATSLDTSVDSEAFASPQGMGVLSPMQGNRESASPVQRRRDTVSPVQTGRGSLSPVQLLRRAEFDGRSPGSRTPSP